MHHRCVPVASTSASIPTPRTGWTCGSGQTTTGQRADACGRAARTQLDCGTFRSCPECVSVSRSEVVLDGCLSKRGFENPPQGGDGGLCPSHGGDDGHLQSQRVPPQILPVPHVRLVACPPQNTIRFAPLKPHAGLPPLNTHSSPYIRNRIFERIIRIRISIFLSNFERMG
jgi:hypothetical protein